MNQHSDQPDHIGARRRRRPFIVFAVGLAWCAAAIVCSALLVPPDGAGGFYLIDHGRIEHYNSRLAAVTPFLVITGLLCATAALSLGAPSLLARTRPTGAPAAPVGVTLAAGFALLLGGLIPLSVTAMAANPDSVWTAWLALAAAALFMLAIFSLVARVTWRAHRAARNRKTEPR
jgi:hypothetical protein